jgi:PKD repeat protein
MASINRTITVRPSTPLASFSISPDPLEGAIIWFNDTSWHYDPLVSWLWSFDDGTSNTSNRTTHILSDGNHSVKLTVIDSSSQSNFTVVQFNVSNSHPVAIFSNTTAIEGALIYFNSTSTCSPFDQIDTINWSFGDGRPNATGPNVTHVYNMSGYFALTITVIDSDGMKDIRTVQIHVRSVLPRVSFAPSPGPYCEGNEIWFNWTGSTTNWIKSFSWSFGDNSSLATGNGARHTFANNGTYRVALTVVEGDDDTNTTFLDIAVNDTNPRIITFRTADARSVYNEDEEIEFIVYAVPTYEPDITNYQFDLDFRSVFNGSLPLSPMNHITYSYSKNSVYFVSVRAYDSDGFGQASGSQVLRIEIRDPKPTAFFNFHNVSSGIVQFDASQSTDNPSDRGSLQYSWNFDDGKGHSAWNGTAIFNYHFSSDNAYNVTLLVKDDSGGISAPFYHQVVVDVTGPVIRLDEDVGAVPPGQVIAVKANITDIFGIGSVWLHYRVNNDSWVVTQMTAMGSLTQYEAQIPGQNDNTSIIYWIEAFDSSNNNRSTGEHRILVSASLTANPGGWYMWLILIAAGLVGFLLYFRSLTAAVDEIFVIYEDGRLIAHQTRRLKPGMDDEILGSMLVAIQSFVRDSFKDESGTHLQRLDFGEKKILVEKGEGIFIAVVLHGQRLGKVPQRMKQAIEDIEKEYSASLSGWDGDLEKVRGVKDATNRMFEGLRLLPNGRKNKPAN